MGNKIYTGIGSRETPFEVLQDMRIIGSRLAELGYTLRSGAAPGADTAFELGCDDSKGKKEIYLPWSEFRDNTSDLYLPKDIQDCHPRAVELAKEFHPNYDNLKYGAKKLMIRNGHQVFGINMDTPSNFVIAWTKDGSDVGGTGQAIRIAEHFGIKVYNIFHEGDKEAVLNLTRK